MLTALKAGSLMLRVDVFPTVRLAQRFSVDYRRR